MKADAPGADCIGLDTSLERFCDQSNEATSGHRPHIDWGGPQADRAMISDATWLTLTRRLDERQLIELPIIVGQYQTVAYYQNSLRLRLHTGNLGLKAR